MPLLGEEALRCRRWRCTLKPRSTSLRIGRQDAGLVVVADRDEHRAVARQVDAGAELRLGEGHREVVVEAHDFAGRAHFRAEQRIDAGEAGERENRFLDGDMLRALRGSGFA